MFMIVRQSIGPLSWSPKMAITSLTRMLMVSTILSANYRRVPIRCVSVHTKSFLDLCFSVVFMLLNIYFKINWFTHEIQIVYQSNNWKTKTYRYVLLSCSNGWFAPISFKGLRIRHKCIGSFLPKNPRKSCAMSSILFSVTSSTRNCATHHKCFNSTAVSVIGQSVLYARTYQQCLGFGFYYVIFKVSEHFCM